jgi:hypothetical protein
MSAEAKCEPKLATKTEDQSFLWFPKCLCGWSGDVCRSHHTAMQAWEKHMKGEKTEKPTPS